MVNVIYITIIFIYDLNSLVRIVNQLIVNISTNYKYPI